MTLNFLYDLINTQLIFGQLSDIQNDLHLLFCSAEHKEFRNTLNPFIMFAYIIFEIGLIGINIIGIFRQGAQHGPYDR